MIITLRPRQDGRHFADNIFNCIFLNEMVWISIKIPLKLVPGGSINNISALVQIMAWRRPGDNLLSEPMMVSLLTHICVTRPQWVIMAMHVPLRYESAPHWNMWLKWNLSAYTRSDITYLLGKIYLKKYFYTDNHCRLILLSSKNLQNHIHFPESNISAYIYMKCNDNLFSHIHFPLS